MEKEFEYVEPSNIGDRYLKHVMAMAPIDAQPVGKSFCIAKDGYSLALLRDIANAKNAGKKALVVVEWPEAFEVQRLPDGASTRLFYKHLGDDKSQDEKSQDELTRILKEYLESDIDHCFKYDKKLNQQEKRENIVSYSYLQRRSAGLALFRQSNEGATVLLKSAIAKLLEIGCLEEITNETFETKGTLYKILLPGDRHS